MSHVVTRGVGSGHVVTRGLSFGSSPPPPGPAKGTVVSRGMGTTNVVTRGMRAGGVLPPVVVPDLRDRGILKGIKALLDATGQFAEVTTSGLPEVQGQSAEYLKLASLELGAFQEKPLGGGAGGQPVERTVQFLLWIAVRDSDADARDDELDRLAQVASNAVDDQSVGGVTFPFLTWLKGGVYQQAEAPERRLKMLGQFVYLVPDWPSRDATP